jgi:hypothetical protein
MLARIDGKSPVEYITSAPDKNRVREFALAHLVHPAAQLGALAQGWYGR